MLTLVTGATGLLGNNVVRELLAQGQCVRVLARANSDLRRLQGLNVQLAEGDIRDASQVRRACEGVRTIVHSAAHVHIGWTQLELARSINVGGTQNVARVAREQGARLIHVSTVDTLGCGSLDRPANEDTHQEKIPCTYVVTKREAEDIVLGQVPSGLDAVVVNPGYMFGPWDWRPSSGRMLLEVAKRYIPAAPGGGASFCDARDVARGILSAASDGQAGRKYILAGHNQSFLETWRLIARVAGRRGPSFRMGPLVRIVSGLAGDLRAKLTGEEGQVNSAMIRMSSLPHYYSSDRAIRELGYRIRPLEDSIETAWRWFIDNGYA